ncbi:uncharacterized protein LOC120668505 isoform X2 [Panicum virgatum]|uniref:DUF7806 domain-containing protein n=1 Tax=Panicum virgatum TaxID=38727 RepID=A0A8T0TAM4_PANVG|nr:uncharacterized protein LOC120668505 isoform X2 [Panicum virgatum]KAG2608040.1 hypothetical protein PVAP13_4NG289900 [Panicum virgatum]
MERKFYEKYTSLKKRKLLDEGLEWKREEELKELYDAMKDWVRGLEKDKEELSELLADKEDELEKARQDFLADIRARDSEILRLKQLLDEKTEKNNSTATMYDHQTPEVIHENPTPMLPRRKTPESNFKAKRVQLSKSTVIPDSSLEEESQELQCSRRYTCISGNETNKCPSAHMFHLLLQSLVRMKVTVDDGTERFFVSVSHEATGYSFSLTWLENPGEWSYKLSSLGTLERIAVNWMKQDIRFSMNMCRLFFERISNILTKG